MVDKQSIIHLYRVKGYGQRRISRELRLNRKTVKKVLLEFFAVVSDPNGSLDDLLAGKPCYDSSSRNPPVMSGELIKELDRMISENKAKRSTGLKKLCMLKEDMHAYLVGLGYKVSYSSVCKYVTGQTKTAVPSGPSEAFIRQEYAPGEKCEFDWGEVKLCIGAERVRLYLAVFTLCYSNARYAYLFRREDMLAFMEAHRDFIRDAGGVPRQMIYDNMRVAIGNFLGREKHPTTTLLRMGDFYKFSFRFCNINSGNEKGHVERSVEYVRRKAFCVVDKFGSIGEANKHLRAKCKGLNEVPASAATAAIVVKHREDLDALQAYTHDMGCFEIRDMKVDKWATICFNNSHYSVPDNFVGQKVPVRIYSEKIRVLAQAEVVAEHERRYRAGWSIQLEHYLDTLRFKPGALAGSTALRQAPQKIRQIFENHFAGKGKDFVSMLLHARENGFSMADVAGAYDRLLAAHVKDVSADQLKALLHRQEEAEGMAVTMGGNNRETEEFANQTLEQLTLLMEKSGQTSIAANL